MSKIKIHLEAIRGTVVFAVIDQAPELRAPTRAPISFTSSNGVTIKSHRGVSIDRNTVYIRGFEKHLDKNVAQIYMGTQDAANRLISRIKFAFLEFAQSGYFEVSDDEKQAYIARLDGMGE